jgi:hypothetical protein
VVCPTNDQKFTLVCREELSYQEHGVSNTHAPLGETQDLEEAEHEEELLESSTLPFCVIQRILAGQRKEDKAEEDWLRINIFHTRVEHHGKSLNVIIDNGNGMNVASHETVQNLKLPLEKHPQPYKLSWVNDTSILVKSRCLILLLVG